MKRISPGFYEDDAGVLHVYCAEFLKAMGWPDTPANRDRIFEVIQEICREEQIEVTER